MLPHATIERMFSKLKSVVNFEDRCWRITEDGPIRTGTKLAQGIDLHRDSTVVAQNVELTSCSGDGGVDVVADIELGITSVREVVQAKRHKRTIQRKDLDALRSSLCRFDAVRGTIVTTARFAKGTQEAAFATGAAPITLVDGDKLIEHGIGVRKRILEVLAVDADVVADLEGEA